jgi:hypothetical protein
MYNVLSQSKNIRLEKVGSMTVDYFFLASEIAALALGRFYIIPDVVKKCIADSQDFSPGRLLQEEHPLDFNCF